MGCGRGFESVPPVTEREKIVGYVFAREEFNAIEEAENTGDAGAKEFGLSVSILDI